VIFEAYYAQKNIIIIREPKQNKTRKKNYKKNIDVWWGGQNRRNSDLILVLAYMLQTSRPWRGSKLHLKTIVNSERYREVMLQNLRDFSQLSRIHVFPKVVLPSEGERIFQDTILNHSKNSDLIFLGLRPPKENETVQDYAAYYENLLFSTENSPPVIFVLSGELFDFGKILK
jgi:hypothetical protein